MQKRTTKLGIYDTASHGWTLTGWVLSEPVAKTKYVDKTGGDGSWDLSTSLTDGVVRYEDRTLTITLELSESDRTSRKQELRYMTNLLDGTRVQIVPPDDPAYYLEGRVHVREEYNNLAHAAVTVTATVGPWMQKSTETTVTLTATTAEQTTTLPNNGRRVACPVIKVTGDSASVLLVCGTSSKAFAAGTYQWPDLLVYTGGQDITYSGNGSVSLTYREAVLS